ncbi:glycoside hydrolase family 47 protein [Ceratocystis lukuohia]|uniref:alpha-1,2-Mannosidase n=1 Tax=Ceratocystis lukuohia TaxID=2019550 RepID=A0ABR4MRG6_9PEZI
MVPRRRSRLVLVAAVIITFLLYKGTQGTWDTPSPFNQQPGFHQASTPDDVVAAHDSKVADQEPSTEPTSHTPLSRPANVATHLAVAEDQTQTTSTVNLAVSEPTTSINETPSTNSAADGPTLKDTSKSDSDSSTDFSLPSDIHALEDAPTTGFKTPSNIASDIHDNAPPAQVEALSTTSTSKTHWVKPTEHFPVAKESYITMPTGSPKAIPKIQFDFPQTEDPAAKALRQNRQHAVLLEMKHAWSGYRTYAWMHDELAPNTFTYKDPFCGWAATLVDSLDTLWIMGLHDEFDEAAKAVKLIDFTWTKRHEIPVFETIIRYLGGLLAAYDVSGGANGEYPVLLEKAIELAEILMGIFDTPNRMPILYYQWQPYATSQPHRATGAGVAELGSMTMEFTRLAQLTGEQKYYDAIARIVNEFEGLQDRGTAIDGLFPEKLDTSGCNKTASREKSQVAISLEGAPVGFEASNQGKTTHELEKREPPALARPPTEKILAEGGEKNGEDWDCVPQPLTPVGFGRQSYGIGGSQDSTYEYFPKQFLLLGGLEPKYEKMHRKAMAGIKKHLLYRAMTNDSSDILFPAKVTTGQHGQGDISIEYEVTHLGCFVGGMFGMGSKIFQEPEELEMAKKLTNGCVWAYGSTTSGIMPEGATVVPCDSMDECPWNQTKWHEHLDRNWEYREKQVDLWEQQKALFLQQRASSEDSNLAKRTAPHALGANGASLDPSSPSAVPAVEGSIGEDQTDEASTLEKEMINTIGHRPQGHDEYVRMRIAQERFPPSFVTINSAQYILRPEAIESVWYMYRITGDKEWMEKGWKMWEAVIPLVKTEFGHSALNNVLTSRPQQIDGMESFWLAETLKYFYLLFSEPDVISLDEWVLNTEAHPFKRPTSAFGRGEVAKKPTKQP